MAVSAIGFEGFEKRLEISFFELSVFLDPEGKGLRALTKSHLDEILTPAECTIVMSTMLLLLMQSCKAFVMGGSDNNPQRWHVYYASSTDEVAVCDKPVYTLEVCMTGLDKKKASVFFKTNSVSASEMTTTSSGIKNILPGSEICDFSFDPCGYSMNSVEGDAVSTIHVTPEDGFSYASFETVGYDLKALNFKELVDRVLVCFGPEEFSVAVHADLGTGLLAHEFVVDVKGYLSQERGLEEVGLGGSVVYQKYVKSVDCCSPIYSWVLLERGRSG